MKVLITGITGMIGSHFAKKMRDVGYDVVGVARSSAASRMSALQDPNVSRCDILDYDALASVFEKNQPDIVIHMAAQAFNGMSWDMEELTHKTNHIGTMNVLKCCRRFSPKAKILLACSSAEYGDIQPKDCPLCEERLLKPITPYGVSKVSTECLGFQYYRNYNLAVFLPRLFIHVGTGHPPATAIQNFARQLALIAKGKADPILYVGNLDTARDFIDVRDGVDAMLLLMEKGVAGEPVNICTGKAHRISDILNMLIKASGMDVKVIKDSKLIRLSDEELLLGDNSKITNLGWSQSYTIEETLSDVYADWLSRI